MFALRSGQHVTGCMQTQDAWVHGIGAMHAPQEVRKVVPLEPLCGRAVKRGLVVFLGE
jgi:hypothetical protein